MDLVPITMVRYTTMMVIIMTIIMVSIMDMAVADTMAAAIIIKSLSAKILDCCSISFLFGLIYSSSPTLIKVPSLSIINPVQKIELPLNQNFRRQTLLPTRFKQGKGKVKEQIKICIRGGEHCLTFF